MILTSIGSKFNVRKNEKSCTRQYIKNGPVCHDADVEDPLSSTWQKANSKFIASSTCKIEIVSKANSQI